MKKYNKDFYKDCNPCPMKNHSCPFLKKRIVCPEKDGLEESFHILLLLAANTRFRQNNNIASGQTVFELNGHNVAPSIFNQVYDWYNKNLLLFVATDTNNKEN